MRRLLIANRGEIAARIIASARELDLTTIALYTDGDVGHTYNASEAIQLSSPSAYLDIEEILKIAQDTRADFIHPGYGFLSESAEFAQRMSDQGLLVVGPGAEILLATGDKLRARQLAEACRVPVLPALTEPTNSVTTVGQFAEQHGYPIMVKAVDGGGGRGIRLIRDADELVSLTKRAIEESPSKQVFAERAVIDGFRHVEVQVVGDGKGNIHHLWERECSIQRRYQKVVEIAPSTVGRDVVRPLLDAAVAMAEKIRYKSLGTFEFLLNPVTKKFYFLEINPRLQVEHTITESICGIDIVQAQLRLAQEASLIDAGFRARSDNVPEQFAIQLRVVAEDPEKDWMMSTGNISSFRLATGNGIRVDTALMPGSSNNISTHFDSVVAKIVVTASSWPDVVSKARRAVEDTQINGINTNLGMLAAIVRHPDFSRGQCDTRWLESRQGELLEQSRLLSRRPPTAYDQIIPQSQSSTHAGVSISTSSTLFRKDDAWTVALTQLPNEQKSTPKQHHLKLQKVLKNDFPAMLSAEIAFTRADEQVRYLMDVRATTASASAVSSQYRRGDSNDPAHVVFPFPGKLIEVCVDLGDVIKKGTAVAVVQQMKMEIEIRSPHDGVVTWICEIYDGEDISEGLLVAVIEERQPTKPRL